MKLYKTKKNCGKLLLGILAFCTGMILLTGCGSSSEQKQNKNEETAEENKEEDKVQIGLTVDSFVIERWIRDRDVFVATARELGAEVNVQDAGADVKEQISQIEYFINKQVDVIVVIFPMTEWSIMPIQICTFPLITVRWVRSWHRHLSMHFLREEMSL